MYSECVCNHIVICLHFLVSSFKKKTALARVPEIAVKIVPAIAECSKSGGNWQKTLIKKFPKETSALSLSTPQLSLLRWVLEGLSFNIVKVRRALSAINKKGGTALIELQNFVHAMSLLEIGLEDEAYEVMYQVNGGEDGGKINFESLSKSLAIASARMENKSDVERILAGVEEGKNWMDISSEKVRAGVTLLLSIPRNEREGTSHNREEWPYGQSPPNSPSRAHRAALLMPHRKSNLKVSRQIWNDQNSHTQRIHTPCPPREHWQRRARPAPRRHCGLPGSATQSAARQIRPWPSPSPTP